LSYLVFDTETTGLMRFDQSDDAPCQPRLASWALLLVNDALQVTAAHCGLVKPNGWTMPLEAERINGLTTEMLQAAGESVRRPLSLFVEAIEDGRTLVAHNLAFDRRVMRGEMMRLGWPEAQDVPLGLCTMQDLTQACGIPNPRGAGFKWPRLNEAIPALLGREFHGAHGALADAMGCLDLLRWIKAQGRKQMAEEIV
jgi:DNA polymerase III epsilon subunit-like protein